MIGKMANTSRTASGPRERISFEADKHYIYKDLVDAKDSPFSTMKDVFVLAACVGHEIGHGTSLKKKLGVFDWSLFGETDDIPILRALAVCKTNDINDMVDRDVLLDIAEEYANTGIDILKQELLDLPGTLTNNLVRFYLGRMDNTGTR